MLIGSGIGAAVFGGGTIAGMEIDSGILSVLQGTTSLNQGSYSILMDNTDKDFATARQVSEVRRLVLDTNKARFITGLNVTVGIFTNNAYDPVTFAFEGVSPGNAETVDPLWQSERELEEEWKPFEAKLRESFERGLLPAPQPEQTHLFSALEAGLDQGRRVAGPDGTVTITLVSDMLVNVSGGMTAYVSERNQRHPVNAITTLRQDRFSSSGLTRIELVGIRRDGRSARHVRDLGELQRRVATLIVAYLERRGAEVTLTWV